MCKLLETDNVRKVIFIINVIFIFIDILMAIFVNIKFILPAIFLIIFTTPLFLYFYNK